MTSAELMQHLLSFEGIEALSHFPYLLLIAEALLLLWLAKKIFGWSAPYRLDHELVQRDNKAATIAFVGYLAGVALILEGVLEGDLQDLLTTLCEVALWGFLGILLLLLAGRVNDKILLRGIDNNQELIEKDNLAVGVAVAGSYLGSALIIRSVLIGESLGWALDVSLTLFYFALGQLAFYLYGLLYNLLTQYDDFKEIQNANPAAGISMGMHWAALGAMVAIPIQVSYSLVLFAAWFVLGSATLVFFRFVMDRLLIPSEKLDKEVQQDRNWGIAVMEGSFALTAVMLMQAIFL